MENKPRLLRITTVPISLKLLLRGQLEFMQQRGFEVLAVSADGPEIESIKANGIRHQIVAMTRTIAPFKDLGALLALIRIIRQFRPQIVHTHTPKAGLLGMLAAWICRVPVRLHTVAGMPLMETQGLKRKILVFTEYITYACATRVYPNSFGLLKFIREHVYGNDLKLKVIGKGSSNGIDSTVFAPSETLKISAAELRKKYAIAEHETVYCFVGRVVKDKGIDELVTAFVRIASEFPAKLILVGPFEDDLDPVAKETRNAIETHPQIISLGYQNDVRPALIASDVFVFPSYREGFPNVVMQASCLGLPCIVSDINGCNEIIDHMKTGWIVKPKQIEPLYEAMRFMGSHSVERKEFARQSRDFVAGNFDQSHVWSLILEEYKKHLEQCT
jgi:glycosyltransferase involved in cell wall biosynthesis